jgi:signal transduction histidine kinase
VDTALGYVAGLCKGRLAEAGLRLDVRCPQGLAADIDPFQVHQAVLNLVVNAIDASKVGDRLLLEGRREHPRTLVLAVENPGEPLPEEVSARIFEPFFSTRASGTGLGLAISRSIASAHGGTALLEVNEPGRVRFAIRLPEACTHEVA